MKIVLDTPLVKIFSNNGELVTHVKMSDTNDILILNPVKEGLEGYISTLTVAQEILAGKFWPAKTVKSASTIDSIKVLTKG